MRLQPKQVLYLRDVLEEQILGTTEPEVLRNLLQTGINKLIKDGVLTRRPGPVTWDEVPDAPKGRAS